MCCSVAALLYKFLTAKSYESSQNKVQRLVLLWTSLCVFILADPYQDITAKL